MKEIAKDIFFENSFPGVILGAVRLEQGLILIDAPLYSRDAQSWRSSLTKTGSSSERFLVLLDEHLDRSIGAKAMKCITIAHERTAQVLGSRPISAKPISAKTGALWETLDDLGTIHGSQPEITFTHSMNINWGDEPVVLEYRAGPSRGATWAVLPVAKVVFIGDCVISNQPPFLAAAYLDAWLESLALLRSAKYHDYILINGRNGMITQEEVKAQIALLKRIHNGLDKLARHKAEPGTTEIFALELLKDFSARNRKEEDVFKARLFWGLQQLYSNHYYPASQAEDR
jgi:glyoxylase-like metal-dependent hydrolase (beta-lactamase superfamily II)